MTVLVREAPTHVLSLIGEASTSMTNNNNNNSPSPVIWTVETPPPTQPQKSVSPLSMLTPNRPPDLTPEFMQGLMKPTLNTEVYTCS